MLNSSMRSSQNVSLLTNDDSKVLGNIKPKLKKLHENNILNTSKFNTLNSSWTPLVDKTSNKIIFEERVELVSNWFDLWNDKQRKWFLLNILGKCRPSQICYLEDAFENFGIYERRDFTTVLPKYLSIYIFSLLSAKDLSRCAQVNSHWRYLSEQDDIWMPKCLKFGWFLPYTPSSRELGAWKSHYVDCVLGINAKPLTQEEAFKYREILYRRELTKSEKERLLYLESKEKHANAREYEKMLSVRRPWAPSSNKPKDLKKTDKLLYSATVDTNQPITSDYLHTLRQQKKNSTVTFRYEDLPQFKNSLDKSKSISQDMLDNLKNSLPFTLTRMKESYNALRKSESDLFKTNLTKSSLNAYMTQRNTLTNSSYSLWSRGDNGRSIDDPHVIFISSKVACDHLLLESVKPGVIMIPYEYEATTLNTLLILLNNALNGRRAKSIGFFLHFEKPGQVAFTQDNLLYKVNVNTNEFSGFFMQIASSLVDPPNCFIDFFVPLASSVDGLELVDKLQALTGVTVRVPHGYLGKFKFIKSKWVNSPEDNPSTEYFSESKLDIWLKYCDILTDAHDKISEIILNGYAKDVNKLAVDKISGKIIFDSLSRTKFLSDLELQQKLQEIIRKTASNNSSNFFAELMEQIRDNIPHLEVEIKHDDNENVIDINEDGESKNPSENLLRSDSALQNFLKNKSEPEIVEPNTRTEIALELIKSEIEYMKMLEIIQKHYARPLKASLDAGRAVISLSVIDIIFGDLTNIYNISKDMVKDFNLRVKSWKIDTCVADVLMILTKKIQSYINYANNYDSILETIDKLSVSNDLFRGFLLKTDNKANTNMMTIQELMGKPWPRIKEYMNLLGSLELHTPKEHADQKNISYVLNKLREFYLYIKQLQERVEKRLRMIELQRIILDAPTILRSGRYLILEQKGILLSKTTYRFVKDITCFLFNDSLLIAYRIKKHFPFSNFIEESLIFYDIIESLNDLDVNEIVDSKIAQNAIHLKYDDYKDFFISFNNFETKHNFLYSLRSARQLSLK